MEKKTASAIMLTLLLASTLVSAFTILPVKAEGTIYIRADGSIDPPTAPIQRNGDVYTFTDNIQSSIDIQRSNLVVDGNGHTLQGNGSGYGFRWTGMYNITVKNVNVTLFHWGFLVDSSENNVICGNNITANNLGLDLYSSFNNTVSGNCITNNGHSIYLIYSSGNTISGNNMANNDNLFLAYSPGNTVSENNITNNRYGVYLLSSSSNLFFHNSFTGNDQQVYPPSGSTCVWDDGYPSGGNYWSDYTDVDLNGDGIWDHPYVIDAYNKDNYPLMTSYVPFENQTIYIRADGSIDPLRAPIQRSGNVYTFTDNIINGSLVVERNNTVVDGNGYMLQGSGSGYGISLSKRENVTIRNTRLDAFYWGIWLYSSSNNSISGNNLTLNGGEAIGLAGSSDYNSISGNDISSNSYGIWVGQHSDYNSIDWNNIRSAGLYGIGLHSSWNNSISWNNITANGHGSIMFIMSSGNNVSCNNMTANGYFGIILDGSSNNRVNGNNIANNGRAGVEIEDGSNYNMIYHNNLVDNLNQAIFWLSHDNTWDDGFPSGGNYWSDYNDVDLNNDGIWDHPYVIGVNNTDNYPLVNPWTPIPPNQPPNCVVRLQKDGIEITEIGVEQFFDIYVGASSDDTGLLQVRFSSNAIRDSPPTGSWTEWYEWGTSSGDWNALEKTMAWAFGTPGYKEVWAEIRDNAWQTDRSCADIYVPGSQPPICNVRLRRSGTQITEVDQGKPIEIYVGDSTDDAAIATVMFSSDDSQDDSPTGEWTEIFDWNSNRGEWYAGGKTMEWSFSTPGKKEVWALITDSDGNAEWNHADVLVHPGYAIIVAGEGGWKEQWGIDAAADNAYRALQSLGFDDDHIVYLNSRFPRDVDGDGADEVDGYAARSYFEDALQDIKNEIAGCPTPLVLYLTGHGDPVDDTVGFYFGNWVYPDDYIFNWQLSPLLNEFSDETPMLIVLGCCYSGTFITSSNSISAPNRIIVTAAHDGKRNYVGWLQSSDRFFGNLKNGLNVKDAFTARALWGDNHNMWLDDNGDRVGHPPNDLQNDGVLSANTRIGYLSAESLALMPWEYYKLGSPGEIFVHDSMNRITGMVNGELKEEIPNSFYDEESSTVVIFWPSDSYYCHVVGNETGTYGLDMVHIEDGTATTFSAVEIGTSPNATHQYIADWLALAQGQQGVTIEVDFNGDGTFEYAFTSDSELTQSEFLDQTAPPPLSVSISPLSAPILVGQSVTFTSTVSGGYTPYGYQWYLNGAPVSEATSNTWAFTPTTGGIYYIHLKVTDAKGNTTQSQTARITAATVPVGGYSIPIERPATAQPVLPYVALIAALTAVFTKLRPRTKRKR